MNKIDQLLQLLQGKEYFIVYGEGVAAREVLACLSCEYLNFNVTNIAITQGEKITDLEINDIPVTYIESLTAYAKDALVLIATSQRYHEEIKEHLHKLGFKSVLYLTKELVYALNRNAYINAFKKYNIETTSKVINLGGVFLLNPLNEFEKKSGNINQLGDIVFPSVYNDWSFVHEGPYEFNNVTLCAGDIVLDLGSNSGVFSALAASRGCLSYAFEPTLEMRNVIEEHSKMNGGKINVIPMAVSDKDGEVTFNIAEDDDGSNTISTRLGKVKEQRTVKCISIDSFVKQQKLQRVDFIKADIEGAERKMIEGAKKTLMMYAPKLAICTYHYKDDPEVLEKMIKAANPNYKVIHKWQKLYAYVE